MMEELAAAQANKLKTFMKKDKSKYIFEFFYDVYSFKVNKVHYCLPESVISQNISLFSYYLNL